MKTVNTLVEKLYKEAKHKMMDKQKADKAAYTDLLKNLIVQVSYILSFIFIFYRV